MSVLSAWSLTLGDLVIGLLFEARKLRTIFFCHSVIVNYIMIAPATFSSRLNFSRQFFALERGNPLLGELVKVGDS